MSVVIAGFRVLFIGANLDMAISQFGKHDGSLRRAQTKNEVRPHSGRSMSG